MVQITNDLHSSFKLKSRKQVAQNKLKKHMMHILGVFSLNKILKDILDGILFDFFIDWLIEYI